MDQALVCQSRHIVPVGQKNLGHASIHDVIQKKHRNLEGLNLFNLLRHRMKATKWQIHIADDKILYSIVHKWHTGASPHRDCKALFIISSFFRLGMRFNSLTP